MRHARLTEVSVEDYLAMEEGCAVRHEYIAGRLFAMAGAGRRHNLIALNIASLLRSSAQGGPCRVFMSDMKVQVEAKGCFYYPDIAVTCEPKDTAATNEQFITSPCLVVEVLSPATEAIDRREKLFVYQSLESLREYVLISQDPRKIEVYRKESDSGWAVDILEEGDVLRLECLETAMTMSDIYEDVG